MKTDVTTAEMIDRILRTKKPMGAALLQKYGDPISIIQNIDALQLTQIQKEALESAFQLRYVSEVSESINSPADSAAIMMFLQAAPKEELWVMVLDRRNRVLDKVMVYRGSVSSSQIRIAEILRESIIRNASAFIVIHNHPTGDPTPSPDDVAVTRAINQAAKLMDLQCLDHIIIGHDKWVSLKERGLGFA